MDRILFSKKRYHPGILVSPFLFCHDYWPWTVHAAGADLVSVHPRRENIVMNGGQKV